jgi:cobalt-zinc-cadmium efflux system protein
MHGHHGHAHSHDHAHRHSAPTDQRYTIAIALNLGFVLVEAAAGLLANSTALFSDAAHNLSDVLGLALAGGAAGVARQGASGRRPDGF